MLMDSDIKISLGLLPCLSNYCSSIYLNREVEQMISNPSVVAIGSVGIESRMTNTMEIQTSVFISFLKIAERTTKTLRIACTGAHSLSSLNEESLGKDLTNSLPKLCGYT